MKRGLKVQSGDVLRVIKAYSATRQPDADNPNVLERIGRAWALCTHVVRDEAWIDWLDPEDGVREWNGIATIPYVTPEYDVFEVVPADEVPDYLWAVIARRALTGDTHGD